MKKLVVALGIALVFCTVGAVQGWTGLRAQRGNNAALAERVAALELAAQAPAMTAAPAPETAVQEVVTQETPARPAVTTGPSGKPAAPAASPPAAQGDAMMAAALQMLSTPAGQEMTRAMMRTTIRQQYPDLQARLNLTPEEADRLYDLLAKHASDLTLEVLQSASTDGVDPFERIGADMQERERANDREIEALLGTNFRKWKEYQLEAQASNRQRVVQQGIDQLRAAVTSTGSPIADDRFKAFHEAVEAEERRFERDTPITSMQQYEQRIPELNRRRLAVAAEHLDAGQLEGYQRYLRQQEDTARMMSGFLGGAAGAQAAPP